MRSQRPFLRETRGDSNVPGKGAQGPPSSWPGDPGFHRPAGPHRAVAPADRAPALPGPARSGPGAVADSAAVAAGRANRGRRGGGPGSLRGGLACGPRTLPATLFKLWVTCSSRTQRIQFLKSDYIKSEFLSIIRTKYTYEVLTQKYLNSNTLQKVHASLFV